MRAVAIALAAALLLAGCMSRPARHDRSGEVSYNRRELSPRPGLFSGPDGEWTVYPSEPDRTDADPPSAGSPAPPPPPERTILLCQEGRRCDPPGEER